MKLRFRPSLGVGLLWVVAGVAVFAQDQGVVSQPGQKLDSGLGELPHYRHWIDSTGRQPMGLAVVGEKHDSGLGDLPHYRHWKDKTGRDPMGRDALQVAARVSR